MKVFLRNFLHRLPLLLTFLVLGHMLLSMGNSPQGLEDPWMVGVVSVIPILLFLGVIILILSCKPGMTEEASEKKEAKE